MATTDDKSKESRVGRMIAGAKQNPLRSLAIGGGALAVLIGVGVVVKLLLPTQPEVDPYRAALGAIEAGDYERAQLYSAKLYQEDLSYEKSGTPFYVLGIAADLEAEASLDPKHRRQEIVLSRRYLEEADRRGFPPGHEIDGLVALAKARYEMGDYALALPVLKQAIAQTSATIPEAERLLAGAYLRDDEPNLPLALKHIQAYLALEGITELEHQQGELEHARILMAQQEFDQAQERLAEVQLPDLDTARLLLKGQLALAQWRHTSPPNEQLHEQALAYLQRAIDRDVANLNVTAPAEYLMGVAHREANDPETAIVYFSRVRRLHVDAPERWSASLAEGELLLAGGENEAALDALQEAAKSVSEEPYYWNAWISKVEFQNRLKEAYSVWMDRGEYAIANEFAKSLPPVVELDEVVLMRADAYRLWGESLMREAETGSLENQEATQADARRHHRTAAKLYAWLADLRFATAYYPREVWNSGEQYLQGHDFEAAIKQLETYLEVELRERHPEALVSLATAQLALGRLDDAQESISTVLENYPSHPASYRARLIGSDVWLRQRTVGTEDELKYFDSARELLEANLNQEALTPRSLEWRDSLFALGHVLAQEAQLRETQSRAAGVDFVEDPETVRQALRVLEESNEVYRDAIDKLTEAIRRYPETPAANRARYELAEAYRNAAKYPRKKLPTVLIQTTRVQLQREMDEQLTAAYELYKDLQTRLNAKQEREDLNQRERAMLRNCYFARADTLFDSRRYEEAIREYSVASNRYQQEPAALEAFVQIASAYRELGRPYEARGTIEQAKIVLERIRDDADFTRTTRFDRRQWTNLLDLLSAL